MTCDSSLPSFEEEPRENANYTFAPLQLSLSLPATIGATPNSDAPQQSHEKLAVCLIHVIFPFHQLLRLSLFKLYLKICSFSKMSYRALQLSFQCSSEIHLPRGANLSPKASVSAHFFVFLFHLLQRCLYLAFCFFVFARQALFKFL